MICTFYSLCANQFCERIYAEEKESEMLVTLEFFCIYWQDEWQSNRASQKVIFSYIYPISYTVKQCLLQVVKMQIAKSKFISLLHANIEVSSM